MRHNYKKQEKTYSCGPAAIRNCLIHFNIFVTERAIRKQCNVTDTSGTNEDQLIQGCEYYGFNVTEIETRSIDVFKRKISKGLKQGKVYIASTEHHNHWVCILDYKNRKVKIVDSDYRKYVDKSIVQYITFKQLLETAHSYNKFDGIKTCYALELELKDE